MIQEEHQSMQIHGLLHFRLLGVGLVPSSNLHVLIYQIWLFVLKVVMKYLMNLLVLQVIQHRTLQPFNKDMEQIATMPNI